MKNSHLGQAWLVIALALCFGAALAGVQAALQPRIEANKTADTLGQIPRIVPGAVRGEEALADGRRVYRALDAAGRAVGWVVPASGQGFADRVELLVGFDAAVERTTGLYVLDQKETPGLGNKIADPGWRAQFEGKPVRGPLAVVKREASAPNEVQAVTGATISSESVVRIVNRAAARSRASLPGADAGRGSEP